jgi:predicted phage terminase large subunit-like protein
MALVKVSRQEAARLLLEREEATATYEGWCRFCMAAHGFAPAAHHLKIIDSIERLIAGQDYRRLLITAPPGSAKTTYSTKLVPGYFFEKVKNGRLIAASSTQENAASFSLDSMQFIRDAGKILSYGLLSEAAATWRTTNGGIYVTAGVGKRIAGKRADLAILDDPIGGAEDVESLEQRDKIWRWYWKELRSRLRAGGRIVLIMTRWHDDDLAGRLLNGNLKDWHVVHMPAEAGEDDSLGRAPGEFLHDDGYPYEDELRQTKKELEDSGQLADWWALYQGKPRPPEGNLFKTERLGYVSAEPAGYRWVRAWDLAASAGKGDWTVGLKMGRGPDKRLVIADVVRFQGGPDEVKQVARSTAQKDGRGTLISLPQDPGQAGKYQVADFAALLFGYQVNASPESGSKEVRAGILAAQVNVGNVSLVNGRWNSAFVDEMNGFPTAKWDDQVDAASRAASELIEPAKPARSMRIPWMER